MSRLDGAKAAVDIVKAIVETVIAVVDARRRAREAAALAAAQEKR